MGQNKTNRWDKIKQIDGTKHKKSIGEKNCAISKEQDSLFLDGRQNKSMGGKKLRDKQRTRFTLS
jgi:hypothetical protein